jgi:choline dehydrogenase-like flavoprotein
MKSVDPTYDYVIIGSGFGGSVSAMRLVEKGYSVLVLECGKRFRKYLVSQQQAGHAIPSHLDIGRPTTRRFAEKAEGYPAGSIILANPGVNPSLTIAALAEYAMSLIPPK